ncbi:membrane protein [Gordonia phage Mariokart]|nr:membrane protein [Gordonia phage Mariokart]
MTPDEARREVEQLVRQSEARREFIVAQTVYLALAPILYSVAIFIYGERLWRVAGTDIAVYRTAMELPNAPESWGSLFMILGVGCLVALWRRNDRWLAALAAVTAIVVCSFMVAFASDFVRFSAPQALPGAIIYGVIGLSFFNLSRLAWVSSRNRVQL